MTPIRKVRSWLSEQGRREQQLRDLVRAGRVTVGRHTYAAPQIKTFASDSTRLEIGSFVSIAGGCTFLLGGNHPVDRITLFPLRSRLNLPNAGSDGFPSTKGDITVGNDVWIGHSSLIVSGVAIGDGAVVAAGSVVTSDVAPYTMVGGVPARVIGSRADTDMAARLIAIAWWDYPDEVIRREVDLLSGPLTNETVSRLEEQLRHD